MLDKNFPVDVNLIIVALSLRFISSRIKPPKDLSSWKRIAHLAYKYWTFTVRILVQHILNNKKQKYVGVCYLKDF